MSIPINHIRKLLNNVNTNLIFVQEGGQLNVCLGENLLFVETMPFDKKYYDFQFKECSEGLDLPYLKDHLRSFSLFCRLRITRRRRILSVRMVSPISMQEPFLVRPRVSSVNIK